MNIVEGATRRRVTVGMVTLTFVLFGMIALFGLKVNLLPDLSYPTLTVRTEYEGAAPLEMENLISQPVEEAIGVVKNLRKIHSISRTGQSDDLLLLNTNGYWTGFVSEAREGDLYIFNVVGAGSHGPKRDPYARDLATDKPFPECSCIIRASSSYPWHDSGFVTPGFTDMIVYQLHIGVYAIDTPGSGVCS